MGFLPITPKEITGRQDFLLVTPEAYVDHPSFGSAIISRLVESLGFSVAIISQPQNDYDYTCFGKPNYGFLVSGGVVDSMVNNYTVAKIKRKNDDYSEGGLAGKRPDRAVTHYTKALKRLFPDSPVIIGGIEASLRRFAHYDYWDDKVLPSILLSSEADLLIFGMGERPITEILALVKRNVPIKDIKDIDGTCYISKYNGLSEKVKQAIKSNEYDFCPSFEEIVKDKLAYVKAFKVQAKNANYKSGKGVIQKHQDYYVIANPPTKPLTQKEMDNIYQLPFMRKAHPKYSKGVPAINEVRFSITSHRGCFGNCSYCALCYHQGKAVSKRSKESIVNEAKLLAKEEDFKGYIHDIGGATANFRNPSCDKQEKYGVCNDKQCIGAKVCENLIVDHQEYLDILREVRNIEGIKKVFIRSGIRFDYLMLDKNKEFFRELVAHHVSGQLKVAPEHSSKKVLELMNKPSFDVYKRFAEDFKCETSRAQKEQYLVPYLISSHPGCDINDAIELTKYLMSIGYMPEQVQDFYPTPGTKSSCMYYTEINPDTLESIYVAKTSEEKKTQRALLQYRLPQNKKLVDELINAQNKTKTKNPIKNRKHKKSNHLKKSYK